MEQPDNPVKASWVWFAYQSSRFSPWTAVITSVGGICGGAIITLSDPSVGRIVLGLGVVVATALPTAGYSYWESKNEDAEDLTATRERIMDESIPPLLEQVCALSSSTKAARKRAVGQAAQDVTKDLQTAYANVSGIRAVVYEVSDDQKKMTVLARSGRSERPVEFVQGTRRGDRAFETLSIAQNFLFEPNIAATGESWAGTGKGYQTFISAPIRVGRSGYGLLTLDAPKVGDLDARDGSTVSLLAATLSIYFSEATRTARNGG